MKLVRYGQPGAEKPGLIDSGGAVRDLSGHAGDIDGSTLSPGSLARLAAIDPASLPAVEAGTRGSRSTGTATGTATRAR